MDSVFVFLSKLLPLFVYPLGLACILLLLALLVRRQGWRRACAICALALLWLGGNRWVATGLARSLEWRYLSPETLPQAEVIVLLGGGTLPAEYPRQRVEISGAGDRVLYAAHLYKQGVAANILLTGGKLDWSTSSSTPAEDMAELLVSLGVPREALWLESESRNTYENALFSARLLEERGIQRILLVTSAMHMPRSVILFESQGLEVVPAPTDFTVTQSGWERLRDGGLQGFLLGLLPSAENLSLTTQVFKEYLGILVYTIRD